jgi:hypothetical protein
MITTGEEGSWVILTLTVAVTAPAVPAARVFGEDAPPLMLVTLPDLCRRGPDVFAPTATEVLALLACKVAVEVSWIEV